MGWVHNLQEPDPNNHIARVIAVCMTFASVSLIAVALRFHIRIYVKKAVWIDDYAALFSAAFAMAYACVAVARTLPSTGFIKIRSREYQWMLIV
jgi:hypothetical protein